MMLLKTPLSSANASSRSDITVNIVEGALKFGPGLADQVAFTEFRLPESAPVFGHVLQLQGLSSNRHGKGAIRAAQILNSRGFNVTVMDVFGHSDPNAQFKSSGSMRELTISRAILGYQFMLDHLATRRPQSLNVLSNSFSNVIVKGALTTSDGKLASVLPHAIAGRSAVTDYKGLIDAKFSVVPQVMKAWRQNGELRVPNYPQVGIEFYDDLQNYSPDKLAANLHKARVPYFAVHSRNDEQVPWSQAERFLRLAHQSDVALFSLSGVGHGLESKFDKSVRLVADSFVCQWGRDRGWSIDSVLAEEKQRAREFPALLAA